jgi:hypothetical protein
LCPARRAALQSRLTDSNRRPPHPTALKSGPGRANVDHLGWAGRKASISGTREGARALGLRGRAESIAVKDLPCLYGCSPHEKSKRCSLHLRGLLPRWRRPRHPPERAAEVAPCPVVSAARRLSGGHEEPLEALRQPFAIRLPDAPRRQLDCARVKRLEELEHRAVLVVE